jgi:monoamine oxidase
MTKLRKFYPYAPDPISWHVTRWEEDIFSQGAYSYRCDDCFTVYKNINKTIFFAGEHTDPIYYGSLHAAYNSGIRVLNEIK